MSIVGATTPPLSLLGNTDSSRIMVIHLALDIKWSNRPSGSHLHSPWAKEKVC